MKQSLIDDVQGFVDNQKLYAEFAVRKLRERKEATEAKEEAKKNKMVMPTIETPDSLKDNLLLKIIKHQIAVLHADMENEKNKGISRSKRKRKKK